MNRISLLFVAFGVPVFGQSSAVPIINTIAGGNPSSFDQNGVIASSIGFFTPQGGSLGPDGNYYFGDFFGGRVRRLILGTPEVVGQERFDTVAGPGYFASNYDLNYTGNSGPAVLVSVAQPQRFAWDSKGNLYYTDVANSWVAMVTTDGTFSIVAGTGISGFSGDGGPAVKAQLSIPRGIAIDISDDIYIGDGGNSRIRKITNGVITTIAGTGVPGFSGDGGPAINAQLGSTIHDLLFGPDGTLYVSGDSLNAGRVRAISPDGKIRTIAGGGQSLGDNGPATQAQIGSRGLAFDSKGNLYVCDNGHGRIRRISLDGIITTVVGGGNTPPPFGAAGVQLLSPDGVAVDTTGRLYITDGTLAEVLLVDTDNFVSVIAGGGPFFGDGGPARKAQFHEITSLRSITPDGR